MLDAIVLNSHNNVNIKLSKSLSLGERDEDGRAQQPPWMCVQVAKT